MTPTTSSSKRDSPSRGDAMDPSPLVTERIDAGKRFLGEFQKHAPVRAAFWLREEDASDWSLYVASDQITDENFDELYGEVLPIAAELDDPWFDPFQVKLVGADHPLAKAALQVQRRYPGRLPARFPGHAFGGLNVADVYVYSTPLTAPAA